MYPRQMLKQSNPTNFRFMSSFLQSLFRLAPTLREGEIRIYLYPSIFTSYSKSEILSTSHEKNHLHASFRDLKGYREQNEEPGELSRIEQHLSVRTTQYECSC